MADESVNINSKKRLVIILLLVTLLLLLGLTLLLWWIITKRSLLVNRLILNAVTIFSVFMLLVMAFGLGALILSIWRSRTYPSLQSIMDSAINFLFPLAIHIGKRVGLDEDRIKNSYIQVSNQLARARLKTFPLKRVLILVPHCLQWSECPHKITIDVENCRNCGACPIKDLKELGTKYEAKLKVVTGGTAARKVIKEMRPQAVVAIACERDLTSGIQDMTGLPVMGIVNERPEGPCCNTRVDLKKVEETLIYLQKGG